MTCLWGSGESTQAERLVDEGSARGGASRHRVQGRADRETSSVAAQPPLPRGRRWRLRLPAPLRLPAHRHHHAPPSRRRALTTWHLRAPAAAVVPAPRAIACPRRPNGRPPSPTGRRLRPASAARWSSACSDLASSCGTTARSRPLLLVIVRHPAGHQHDDFFITSDTSLAPAEAASLYSDRCAIEDTQPSPQATPRRPEPQSWVGDGPERVVSLAERDGTQAVTHAPHSRQSCAALGRLRYRSSSSATRRSCAAASSSTTPPW